MLVPKFIRNKDDGFEKNRNPSLTQKTNAQIVPSKSIQIINKPFVSRLRMKKKDNKTKLNLRISTFLRDENNYGQRLQNYALQEFLLKNFNCQVSTYDIRTIYNKFSGNSSFYQFEDQLMWFKKINYIQHLTDDADYYIFGGDQIYNNRTLRSLGELDLFLMPYINANKKIMYSASDNNQLDNGSIVSNAINDNLRNFRNLSFREIESVKKLKEKGFDVENHIDPIFLLDVNDWRSIMRRPSSIEENEIFDFTYVFDQRSNEITLTEDGIKNYICYGNNGEQNYDPREWLWMVYHCRNFMTSSYHGICFSILFNKGLDNVIDNVSNNFRKSNLFEQLQIQNDTIPTDINEIILKQQEKSLQYFKNILTPDTTNQIPLETPIILVDSHNELKNIRTRLPKNIFMLWFGEEIPEYVNFSVQQMKRINNDFNVIFINEKDPLKSSNDDIKECLKLLEYRNTMLNDFYNIEHEQNLRDNGFFNISFSDMFRYYLINKYGGIYVDCDTVPVKCFDDYLIGGSFFAAAFIFGKKYRRDGFFFGNRKGFIQDLKNFDQINLRKKFDKCLFNYVQYDSFSDFGIDDTKALELKRKFLDKTLIPIKETVYDRKMMTRTANFEENYYLDHFFVKSWEI